MVDWKVELFFLVDFSQELYASGFRSYFSGQQLDFWSVEIRFQLTKQHGILFEQYVRISVDIALSYYIDSPSSPEIWIPAQECYYDLSTRRKLFHSK